LEYLIKPWKHQLDAIETSKELNHFALFFEMGCLARDSEIKVSRGGNSRTYTIETLYRLFNKKELAWNEGGFNKKIKSFVRSLKGETVGLHEIDAVYRSGIKDVYRINVLGMSIKATREHKFLTRDGWKKVSDLSTSDYLAVDLTKKHQKKGVKKAWRKPLYNYREIGDHYPYGYFTEGYKGRKIHRESIHRIVYQAAMNELPVEEFIERTKAPNKLKFICPKKYHIHHIDENTKNNSIENLVCLRSKEHLRKHSENSQDHFGHGGVNWRKVRSIKRVGEEMTYDIVCKDPYRNFVANGFIVHNSGKTATCINMLRLRYAKYGRILKTIIFAPPVVLENWKREFLAHSKIKEKNIIVLSGREKLRVDKLWASVSMDPNRIFITNYEAMAVMPELRYALNEWVPEVLVCDESHKLKNPESKRTKFMIELADKVYYKFLLTGTPILNTPLDLFSQFRIMDGGELFGKNFFSFRARYFYDKNAPMPKNKYFPNWLPKKNSYENLATKIKTVSMRVKKDQCLDLPPLVREKFEVEMSIEQQTHYTSMRKHLITYLEDEACVAQMALTKALRLQQIVSGFIKLDNGDEVTFKETPRQKILKELIEEYSPLHKIIVWAVFRENYKQIIKICNDLEVGYVELHGDVPAGQKIKNVDSFNHDEHIRVLVGHPGSGGIGVNLTASDISVFYSRGFSLEFDQQAEARNHRGGSEIHKKVTRIDLVTPNSLDEEILQALDRKEAISHEILKDMVGRS